MAFKMGYNFEGHAHLRPEQNLSGSSRKLSRDMLIQKMHEERRKRQEHRLRLKSVQTLQASIRSFILRKHEKQNQRNDYLKLKTALNIPEKLSRFLFFYDPDIDLLQLFDLANDMLINENVINHSIITDTRLAWLVKRFLLICVKNLNKNGTDLMMKVVSTFCYSYDIHLYLIQKGYFNHLRKLLDDKEVFTMDQIITLIQRSLACLNILNHQQQDLILKSFCDNFLNPSLNLQRKAYFLPYLQARLNLSYYDRIIQFLSRNDCRDYNCSNMFYSLLLLEPVNYEPNCASIKVLAMLTNGLYKIRTSDCLNDFESNEYEEEDDVYRFKSQYYLLSDYSIIFNSLIRVGKFINLFQNNYENEIFFNDFINICHNLLLVYKDSVKRHLLLYSLGINKVFLKKLWLKIHETGRQNFQFNIFSLAKLEIKNCHKTLSLFCSMFTFYTEQLTDKENSDTSDTFNLSDFQEMSKLVKNVTMSLIEIAFPINKAVLVFPIPHEMLLLYRACISCLRTLYILDMRINFYHPEFWISITIPISLTDIGKKDYLSKITKPFSIACFTEDDDRSLPPLSIVERRSLAIIQQLPFLISFNKRFILLRELCKYSLDDSEFDRMHQNEFMGDNAVIIRRNYLYEDAFEKLSTKNDLDLKLRLRIQFINNMGMDEVGIDGGGIFKEFLNEVLRTAFDPNRGFFLLTADNMLYPNPNVQAIMKNYMEHYRFIGRLVGKAIFENILVDVPLAEFFLNKLLVDKISACYLISLDPELHKNLLYLRDYSGDVSELGLDFSTVCHGLGETTIVDLKPNGRNIQVTNKNRLEYIQLLADLKLNGQLRNQCSAFKEGLNSVVPLNWLKIFTYKELQIILNGKNQDIDLVDLKSHTAYSGEFSSNHPTILLFWKILSSFTAMQKRQLLKFVTSCSRPPLLGFKELNPPFCIQSSGTDDNRMPTASTCLNLLKIPIIDDEKILETKLLAAIAEQAGFDLS